MNALQRLQERRLQECRLVPERALESFEEAADFLADRGLLTRTADSALPSLFGASHEQGYRPGKGGFAEWPRTKYPWAAQLSGNPRVTATKIHRGKELLLSAEIAALADPLCRAELARNRDEHPDEGRLLDHLAAAGPSRLDDLKAELGWNAQRLRAARLPLERTGALVSRSVAEAVDEHGHRHTSVLARWDQVHPEPSKHEGFGELLVAAVRAAVIAPEPEMPRWFSWNWVWHAGLVDDLVVRGRLERPAPGFVSVP